MTPTELAWKWMNHPTNFYELSEVVHRSIEEKWRLHVLGEEIMKHFYAQVPYFGAPALWMEVLDACLEDVDWTALARRALREAEAA